MFVFMQNNTQKFYVLNLRNSRDVKKIACFLQNMQTLQVNNLKNSYDKKYKTFRTLCWYEPEYIGNPQAIFISLYFL